MVKYFKKIVLIAIGIFCFGVQTLYAQIVQPVHIQELENHRNDIIPYSEIDRQVTTQPQPSNRSRNLNSEIIGYLPYWMYSVYPDLRYDLLTQINYFSAELNQYGDIINSHNWANLGFIEYAQSQGVKVKLTAVLFDADDLTTLLSSGVHRQNAINNLLAAVTDVNADGVDIDFETLPLHQRENLVTFMTDLVETFHSQVPESVVTMATPPVDWSGAWDYNSLANITDGLFIMGYNYHWSGSGSAGPVSPLGGFYYDIEYTVDDYLYYTNNNSEKLILGLPYFGYDWPVENDNMYSPTTGIASSRTYSSVQELASIQGSVWDESSNSQWIPYFDDQWRQCWYDDSLSLSGKYAFANNRQLSGIGIWALGYDDGFDELWEALETQFSDCESTGDVNLDGSLDILDIIVMVANILEELTLSETQFCQGDINSDSIINISDIIIIISLILDS
jgi:spore germination protein YaaH